MGPVSSTGHGPNSGRRSRRLSTCSKIGIFLLVQGGGFSTMSVVKRLTDARNKSYQ